MNCPAPKNALSVDIPALLERCELFHGVSDELLQQFTDMAQVRSAPKGKVLFIQDDEAKWFYLIIEGWVKLFCETLEGTEAVIDVLTDGHLFGENAMFENNHYSYSAEMVESTQYISLPTSLLNTAIKSDNQLALNMLSGMSRCRRQQHREIEHLNLQNAPQRIGCFLLRLCPAESANAIHINLPYDKTLIAARLGMKPETFSRALAKLKAEARIEINGPSVIIHDLSRLITYTCNQCSSSFPCEE